MSTPHIHAAPGAFADTVLRFIESGALSTEWGIRIDRLKRWWRSGLICIGDAAHAMSPMAFPSTTLDTSIER